MDGNPNTLFIQEKNLKPILHPVGFLDALFPVYNKKNGKLQKAHYFISTKDFMKWLNKTAIELGMGNAFYPNFVPFMMDNFERNLYLYYFNWLNPSPRIEMKLKSNSSDTVQGNDFLQKGFGCNDVRQHREFK